MTAASSTRLQRALLYWDQVDPGNTNWWETEIGESIAMGRIAMFLGPELSAASLQVALKHNTGKLDPVGANGAWRTSNYLFEALATHDLDKVRAGFATIVATIEVDDSGTIKEAVQPDGTFWAHGAQLFSEGYGMVLFTYAALWADVARGTGLAFTRGQLDAIAFYAVDGTRWLIRGEIGMLYLLYRPAKTNQGVTSYASDFIEPLQRMVRTDALYATAYQGLLDSITGKARDNGVTGNTYFWRSEFGSHLRDTFGIFTRLNSSRMFGGELRTSYRDDIGNPVYWNAAGATAIQVNNHEYLDLGPTFDWRHYPGVTAPDQLRPERGVDNRSRNGDGGSFTGGVSDGQFGASVLTLDAASTSAQKSYFTFDEGMVALGAGIRSTADAAVHTTINQVIAKDNASVGGAPVAAGTTRQSIGTSRWAYNDEVGYVFAPGQSVTVSRATQTGNWEGEDAVSHEAFSLYVDHGTRPSGASYDYTVLPAATPAQVQAYVAAPAVRTLRNDGAVQAVRHDRLGITMATFFAAGSLDLGDGRTLSVDAPSLVILDERGQTPVVSVANPDRAGLVVGVTLRGQSTWHGEYTLGRGADQGKTVTAALVAGEQPQTRGFAASSTAEGTSAAALGDGDLATGWRSQGTGPAWVSKRLPRGFWATSATIEWEAGAAADDVIVQTSPDGRTWTDQAHVTGAPGAKTTVPFSATAAAYVRLVLLGTDGAAFGIREVSVAGGVNLAIDAGTRASGYTGFGLAYQIADGDPATRWSGNNTNSAWAQIDLGAVHPVGAVRLSWEAAYAKTYKIQLSDDGTAWRDAYTTPAAGSDGGIDVVTLTGQSARFVRMQTLTRATAYGPSLWEFEVFEDRSVVDAPVIAQGPRNLALGRPATADSVYNNLANIVPGKATDGSTSTKWSSARSGDEHWLQVDLGQVQSVSRAIVKWETGTSNDYRLEGSVDQSTWVPLARVSSAQPTLTHTLDFTAADVRYVRLAGVPATQYGLNVWELELYGGFTFTCDPTGAIPAGASGSAHALLAPVVAGDAVRAYSLDDAIVQVSGAPQLGADGGVSVGLQGGSPGTGSVVLTHAKGSEVAWCVMAVQPDMTALREQITRGDGLVSSTYTAASWKPVLPALSRAKTVAGSSGAAQAEVDAAAKALRAAIDGLAVPQVPDTTRPLVTLVSPTSAGPLSALRIEVSATDDVALAKIVTNIYDGSGKLVKSTQSPVTGGTKAGTHVATPTLPDGAYTLKYNAHDAAGNVSKTSTFAFAVDSTKPTATVKDGSSFTVKSGDAYDRVSFKLYDAGKIDRVELNGVVKKLTPNAWSDVNFVMPGVFGAVAGQNTLVVFDVAGNANTYSFTLTGAH